MVNVGLLSWQLLERQRHPVCSFHKRNTELHLTCTEHYNLLNMPWPNWILKQFAIIPGGVNNATREYLLYDPYNTILHYLFPPEEDSMVVPQYQRPTIGQSIDFTTIHQPTPNPPYSA